MEFEFFFIVVAPGNVNKNMLMHSYCRPVTIDCIYVLDYIVGKVVEMSIRTWKGVEHYSVGHLTAITQARRLNVVMLDRSPGFNSI